MSDACITLKMLGEIPDQPPVLPGNNARSRHLREGTGLGEDRKSYHICATCELFAGQMRLQNEQGLLDATRLLEGYLADVKSDVGLFLCCDQANHSPPPDAAEGDAGQPILHPLLGTEECATAWGGGDRCCRKAQAR
jgi:hypothetical protein